MKLTTGIATAAMAALLHSAPALAQQQDTLALTVDQAISVALASNLGLQSAELDTQIQQAGVRAAEARFGRRITGSATHQAERSPSISTLEAVHNATSNAQTLGVGVSQVLTSGGWIGLELRNTRTSSNAAYYTIDPVYRSALELRWSQPLLRGRGRVNLIERDLTRNELAGARADLSGQMRSLRSEAALAYWRLFAAQVRLEVARQQRDGTVRVLETVRSRAQMGAGRRCSILEAEVGVAQREEEIVVAEGAVHTAEDELKSLCGLDRDAATLAMAVALLDTPGVTPFTENLDAGVARALDLSTSYQRARLQVESLGLQIMAAQDQTRPEVNLNAQASLIGMGADHADNMEGLVKADGHTWGGSISLSVPLGQSTEKAVYARRLLEKQRRQVDLEEIRFQVARQVREQHRQVHINLRRIQAARAAVALARQNVEEQETRLALGLSTVREVLDAQDDLASARGRLLQATVDYTSAVVRWNELTQG